VIPKRPESDQLVGPAEGERRQRSVRTVRGRVVERRTPKVVDHKVPKCSGADVFILQDGPPDSDGNQSICHFFPSPGPPPSSLDICLFCRESNLCRLRHAIRAESNANKQTTNGTHSTASHSQREIRFVASTGGSNRRFSLTHFHCE
jgi:hypothetical protein